MLLNSNRFDFPITKLSFTQKLDLMELLWANLIGNEKKLESPAWHEAVLNDRETALNAGKITESSAQERNGKGERVRATHTR